MRRLLLSGYDSVTDSELCSFAFFHWRSVQCEMHNADTDAGDVISGITRVKEVRSVSGSFLMTFHRSM